MKTVGLFFLAILTVFGVFFAVTMYHLGITRPVAISQTVTKPMHLLYEIHYGPYNKIEAVIESIQNWARLNSVPCPLTFGEFLDDPEKTEAMRLRAYAGCVVNGGRPSNLPPNFIYETVKPMQVVKAVFSGSPAIGPWKVYPRVHRYMRKRHLPYTARTFEIYDVLSRTRMRTTYYFPVTTPSP